MENKTNLIDYINWRGDLSFSQSPFNNVDALVLNLVSFLNFENFNIDYPLDNKINIVNLIDSFFKLNPNENRLGLIIPSEIFLIAKSIKNCNRYANIKVSNFINKIDQSSSEQFSALVFHLDKESLFVSFRGTDDTLIGWAEDVNLLAEFPVPAQKDAKDYLNKIANMYPDKSIYIGGHSKGGNLSVYASIYCDEITQGRIKEVYSFDGPGFMKNTLDEELFNKVKNRIYHIIPNGGIVGRLFSCDIDPTIIKSYYKGLDQHNPFSWVVERNSFKKVDAFSKNSNKIKKEIDSLIEKMNDDEKKDFAKDLNQYLDSLKQNNLIEFLNLRNVMSLLSNKYKMKHKNIRYLLKLYFIFSKYDAIHVKISK